MADLKTWIDVADDAVKIGLGALIGGGFGVWVAWLSNRVQAKRTLNERRRQILELVIESVDGAANSCSMYWSNLANAVYKRGKGDQLSESDLEQLEALQAKFFESFIVLNSSGAKLFLLDEAEAELELVKLRTSMDSFFKIANRDSPNCTAENLKHHREEISVRRKSFYSSMSKAYKRSV